MGEKKRVEMCRRYRSTREGGQKQYVQTQKAYVLGTLLLIYFPFFAAT